MGVRTVPEDRLFEIIRTLLEGVDMPPEHARRAAHILVLTSVRGVDTHGVEWLGRYVDRLLDRTINPRPDIKPLITAGSMEVWDGDGGLGHVCGSIAMERAIEVAREKALAWVMIRNSNHYGAAGSYVMMAVEQGFVAISCSNCGKCMAVHGAAERTIGNNPCAIGAPSPRFPVVLDMAMSVTAGSNIIIRREKGLPVPEEWVVGGSEPQHWALKPFAGPKGSGLAIMVEILTGILSGGADPEEATGQRAMWTPLSGTNCHTQIVIDPRALIAQGDYDSAMDHLVEELKSAQRAPGVDEIRLPGERAWRETQKRRAEGIPLDEHLVGILEESAGKIGVAIPW